MALPIIPDRSTRAYKLLKELTFAPDDGLCSQDPEQWFATDLAGINVAKRICKGVNGWPPCPLLNLCLEYAVAGFEQEGVWGGTSPEERRSIRRKSYRGSGSARRPIEGLEAA